MSPNSERFQPPKLWNAIGTGIGTLTPTTPIWHLGLHFGVVFYGNIGSKERLDFTVVGPAVNEVSRIAAMCRSVDQPMLLSSEFVTHGANNQYPFVSVGRYALRGVGKPQELFTLDRLEGGEVA